MVSKFLPVGLMVFGISGLASVANAQQWGGCSPAPGPAVSGWNGPSSYQPPGAQNAIPPAPGGMTNQQAPAQAAPAPQAGQTAQFNNPTYQSFSAEPPVAAPMYSNGPTTGYAYPQYGGYYYGTPYYYSPNYYGGSYGYSRGWRSLDNANHHGTSF
jgi:hypothetical protein